MGVSYLYDLQIHSGADGEYHRFPKDAQDIIKKGCITNG